MSLALSAPLGPFGRRLRAVSEAQTDRYYALGQVVEMAAVMEIALRMAFCALVGSKYAAVVAGARKRTG
jgi:hypothetical protein